MKKITLLLLGLLMITSASAYDFMVDGLAYNINEDSTSVSVTYLSQYDFHNYEGIIEIDVPAEVVYQGNTYTVTKIGEKAFNCCPDLQKISLANTVTSVGRWAFDSCNKLEDIDLGSVKQLARAAFQYDKILQSITIPEGVECLDTLLFQSCISLSNVKLPTTLKELQRSAFYGCKSLVSIDLPPSLAVIGDHAFSMCSALSSVTLPKSLETIETNVFYGCNSMTSLYSRIKTPQTVYCNNNAFTDIPKSFCTLYIPQGTIYSYLATSPWNEFLHIMEMAKPDINWDGAITATDVTALYDKLLGNAVHDDWDYDINGDGTVTAVDVTAVYNILLGNGN